MTFLMMVSVILLYMDDTTLYSKHDQACNLWQQLELASEVESGLGDTVEWGRKWHVILILEKLDWFRLTIQIIVIIVIVIILFLKKA